MPRKLEDNYIGILNYIVFQKQTTYKEIGDTFNISPKTVKKYVDEINDYLAETQQPTLEIKQGIGVVFEGNPQELTILNQYHARRDKEYDDRTILILTKLLQSHDYLKIQDIADEMFVSRTTVENALKVIKTNYLTEGLEFESNRNGIKINGSETLKRKEMTNILRFYWGGISAISDQEEYQLDIQMLSDSDTIIDEELLDKVTTLLNVFIEETHLNLTDYEYQSLAIHIAIAVERIRQGFYIQNKAKEEMLRSENSDYLIELIEQNFDIKMPDFEKEYIAIHISAIETNTYNGLNFDNFSTLDHSFELLNIIQETLNDYQPDNELIKNLLIHLNAAVKRLKLNISINNPYTQKIKNSFPRAYNLSVSVGEMLEEQFEIELNEDELSYITLHIQAFFDRNVSQVKKVILVCSSGYGTSKFLEQRILKRFGDTLDITRVISINDLMNTSIDEDLIISTIPIQNSFIPVIQVSPLFNEQDIKNVEQHFGFSHIELYETFYKLIAEDLTLIVNRSNDTMENVITTIGNTLITKGYAREGIIESAIEREALSTTAMGQFSMPHANVKYINTPSIFIYINSKGIEWNGENVKLVFFFGLNPIVKDSINDVYVFFNELVSNTDLVKKLISVKSFEEIEGVLREVKL